tara:strand:- start:9 stop:155 length:147 start_codon:yes stop_codon:yes gene_type:complete
MEIINENFNNKMNNPDKIIFQIISRYIDLETNKLNKNISIENTPEWAA